MQLPRPSTSSTDTAQAALLRSNVTAWAALDDLGNLAARFPPRPIDSGFIVRRLVVQGPAGSYARVYAGEPDPLNMADATSAGASDVADYAQPLYVPATLPLVVVWQMADGTTPADHEALARAEIEDIR